MRLKRSPRVPAEAGHWGKDVRSDLHVAFERATAAESRSRWNRGSRLTTAMRSWSRREQVLEALGVKHARVAIHDEGALPFVIAARIEAAAARGLGWRSGSGRCPNHITLPSAVAEDRLRRSRLYLPGSEPKYFINAALHGPDAIILDLEDSVHRAEKDAARILVRNTLRAVDFGACERMVRINQLPLGLEDLAEIIGESPDLILIPKVERPEQVAEVDRMIGELKSRHGIDSTDLDHADSRVRAWESKMHLRSRPASENVAALTIGLEDYTADLGVAKTLEGRESQYARARLVNAARAAGVQAIDSVFGDVGDMEGLRRWGEDSRALGFEGMGCFHPGQIRSDP